ncbi:hypothetical protein C0J52_05571 [Blattella germanica]|nr:hypothetical protein C0J52_05571 [Blattella germanica]
MGVIARIMIMMAVICLLSSTPRVTSKASPPECTNSNECPTNNCCFISQGHTLQATCEPLLEENADCPMGNEATNTTINYYDDDNKFHSVAVIGYFRACPCGQGLICQLGACKKA